MIITGGVSLIEEVGMAIIFAKTGRNPYPNSGPLSIHVRRLPGQGEIEGAEFWSGVGPLTGE